MYSLGREVWDEKMPSQQSFKGRERKTHLEISLSGRGSDVPEGAHLGPLDEVTGVPGGRAVCCGAVGVKFQW